MASGPMLDFEKPILELEKRIEELHNFSKERNIDLTDEISTLERKAADLRREIYGNLTGWQKVQLARHPGRPFALDYFKLIFEDFMELHGDRQFRDDPAVIGGVALLDGRPVTVIGTQKGRDTKENIFRNFGMPHPEGYRKALRLMVQADKFRRPIICIIDTPAAYPGVGAEERGQAEAIARNMREMFGLKVPIVVAITGEGGSGGALALGVGNRVIMLENAIYSVCPPESCAAIIWRDGTKAKEAAEALKLTAKDLLAYGIIDEVVPEPPGGAHKDHQSTANAVKEALVRHLNELVKMSSEELISNRYEKFRRIGRVAEVADSIGEERTS